MRRRRAIAVLAIAALAWLAPSPTVLGGPAADQIALLEARLSALETRVAALEGDAPSPTSSPLPTSSPSATPSPVLATPSPSASQSPSPSSSATTCPTNLQSAIDATPAGGTLDVTGCSFTGSFAIRRAITLAGARFVDSAWTLQVSASDVVLRDLTFERQRETSIRLTGAGTGPVLIERVRIVQTVNVGSGYSPISGACPGCRMHDITIRDSFVDQGPDGIAWGGLEVWDTDRLVIERNTLAGSGFALVSIPRSDGAVVRNNTFRLTQALWGIEAADVDDVVITGNTATGPNRYQRDGMAFVQLHPGSGQVLRARITNNAIADLWALVNAAGAGHTITDNCLTRIVKVFAYSFAGAVTLERNGPCA